MQVHFNISLLLRGNPYKPMVEFHKGRRVVSLLNLSGGIPTTNGPDLVFPHPDDRHMLSLACFEVPRNWKPKNRKSPRNITYKVLGVGEDACDGTPFKGGYETHGFTEERWKLAMEWLSND